jgi:hypothetical protein
VRARRSPVDAPACGVRGWRGHGSGPVVAVPERAAVTRSEQPCSPSVSSALVDLPVYSEGAGIRSTSCMARLGGYRKQILNWGGFMATDPEANIRALNDVGVDFSIPRESLLSFLQNQDFTPYPAVTTALLLLLRDRGLRRPVFLDVIVFNYENTPGVRSPRLIEDVDFAVLKAAVIEGFNNRHGERVANFPEVLTPGDGAQPPGVVIDSAIHKGHRIERIARGADIELALDGVVIPYGRHPDGRYSLRDYAYDPSRSLVDVAKKFIDYQSL